MTKRKELSGQLALDGFADAPVVPVPKRRSKATVTWVKYRPRRSVRCDDCVTVLELAPGHQGPATRSARWRRTADDGTDLLLCSAHAEQRREFDAGRGPQ